jgi:hypothetical protein
VLNLLLRKGVKSLQVMLNEAMQWLEEPLVTASAYSQARYKLKHTAFIALNQGGVVDTMYREGDYQTYWDFRVLAIDGSRIQLPDSEDVRREFGTIAWHNGSQSDKHGSHPYTLASVLYDVLNRIALDARLEKATAYEVDAAIEHLAYTQPNDLLLMDRNYPSYRMIAELTQRQRAFVIRCSSASFKVARQQLKGQGQDSQTVTLKPCAEQLPNIKRLNLPTELRVRFVRVTLPTGESEVLVTNLLDTERYPSPDFLPLYHLRWGIETFFGLLKTRLTLENFTGNKAEAVKQDFFATLYLTGMESILTDAAQAILNAKHTTYPQHVNRAVSFNAIKFNALDLLMTDTPIEPLLEQLTALFLSNPCTQRKQRNPPRKKSSDRLLLGFHKRQKKLCF